MTSGEAADLTASALESAPAGWQVSPEGGRFFVETIDGTDDVVWAQTQLSVIAPDGSVHALVWDTFHMFCDGRSAARALPLGGSLALPVSRWYATDLPEPRCARATLHRAADGAISADVSLTDEVGGCGRPNAGVLDRVAFTIESTRPPTSANSTTGSCDKQVRESTTTAALTQAGALPDGWLFDDSALQLTTIPGSKYEAGSILVDGLFLTRPATQDWTPVYGPQSWETCPVGFARGSAAQPVRLFGDATISGSHRQCFPGSARVEADGKVVLSGVFRWPCPQAKTKPKPSTPLRFSTRTPYEFFAAPLTPKRIFTVQQTPAWPSGVLFESADGGVTWTAGAPLPLPKSAPGRNIVELAPLGDGDTLLAQDHRSRGSRIARIVRSTDSGASWTTVLGTAVSITSDPRHPASAWACSRGRVTRTDDHGTTWTRTSGRCSDVIAVSSDGQAVLARSAGARVSTSVDRGRHWRSSPWEVPSSLDRRFYGIVGVPAFDATHARVAFAFDDFGIYRSADRGLSWRRVWKVPFVNSAPRLNLGGERHEPPRFVTEPGRIIAGPFIQPTTRRGWVTLVSYDTGRHWSQLQAVINQRTPPLLYGAVETPRGVIAPVSPSSSDAPSIWLLAHGAKAWRYLGTGR